MKKMPVFVHFETPVNKHVMELTTRDIEIHEGNLHPFYRLVFSEMTFLRSDLILITQQFINFLSGIRSLIEYEYRYHIEHYPYPGFRDEPSTGSSSGFRVKGQYASVTAYPARCEIQTMKLLPDGKGEIDRTIDLREIETFQTDDMGKIFISKRKAKLRWFDELPMLLDFLDKDDSAEVSSKVVWGRPSVLQLIRRLAIRDDPGGGCGDELYQMGDEGRIRLLELLSNSRHRKYHPTIAEFLCTMYPSDTIRNGVEQAIAKTQDEHVKTELNRILKEMD